MKDSTTKSIIGVMGVVGLVLGLMTSALAAPPENNPGKPFEEILAQTGMLNDKLDGLQGDMDNLQGDVENLQGDVDNLPAGLGPCAVPPVWGTTYATADRFVSVLGGAAFCDKATGLVWEGSPDTKPYTKWQDAISHCTPRTVGGVNGFHLPLIEQLASLLPLLATDLNSATGDGPFTNVQAFGYWSATTGASNPSTAWGADFVFGDVTNINKVGPIGFAWCVRGGQAFDGNTHTTLH